MLRHSIESHENGPGKTGPVPRPPDSPATPPAGTITASTAAPLHRNRTLLHGSFETSHTSQVLGGENRYSQQYPPNGTVISRSVAYCEQFIESPRETLFILLTDLYEGGNQSQLVRRLGEMVGSGVKVLCLLALSDSGVPSYDAGLAKKLADLGIPCFGCTPDRMPDLVEGALRGDDLNAIAARVSAGK